MDEMCQDLGMTGVVKNAGRPFRSVEAFHNRWRAKNTNASRRAQPLLVERDRYGTGRHKKSLNLGNKKSSYCYMNLKR